MIESSDAPAFRELADRWSKPVLAAVAAELLLRTAIDVGRRNSMFRRCVSCALIGLLIHICCVGAIYAKSNAEKETRQAEKVRAGILKLGVGTEARVSVKLRDKTRVTGYVSEARDGSFVVTDSKTGESTAVDYRDVAQVKGHNLSTGAKIGIGIAIGVGVALLIILLIRLNNEGGL